LWRALNDVANGYYIDIGPAPSDGASVTRAFYDRGWNGILIRASAEVAATYSAARPRDAVIGEFPLPDIASSDVHILIVKDRDNQLSILRNLSLSTLCPWIVLIEAGCVDCDIVLRSNNYKLVLFDGINHFYLSSAHLSREARLIAPANANDHFVRWDAPLTGQVAALKSALVVAQSSIEGRSKHLLDAIRALGHARRDIELLAEDAAWLRGLLAETRDSEAKLRAETVWLQGQLSDVKEQRLEQLVARTDEVIWLRGCLRDYEEKAIPTPQNPMVVFCQKCIGPLYWGARRLKVKLTRPDRRLPLEKLPEEFIDDTISDLASPLLEPYSPLTQNNYPTVGSLSAVQPESSSYGDTQPLPATPSATRPITAIHQFHAGSGRGDAITNAMLLIQSLLRGHGFASEIFVESRGPGLEDDIQLLHTFPVHDASLLLVHHSMGYSSFDEMLALPVPKGLIYHNITPPEFFSHLPKIQRLARLGHEQLAELRDHVIFTLSVSEYNTAELHRLDFPSIQICPLLCDIDALLVRAAQPRLKTDIFTVLFVGRLTRSKAQLDLVASFAAFRAQFGRPCRLVLIGSLNPDEYGYQEEIEKSIAAGELANVVQLTGLVSDDELHAWYRQADLYVSLSCHEGFCVPLVEAMAYGIPILAWPAGAVPQTLGDSGTLLASRDPEAVASAMLNITQRNAEEVSSARTRCAASLQRFTLQKTMPILLHALAQAGVVSPMCNEPSEDKPAVSS
jgi:glycosyltransferase involved in cell wall biosynthesis